MYYYLLVKITDIVFIFKSLCEINSKFVRTISKLLNNFLSNSSIKTFGVEKCSRKREWKGKEKFFIKKSFPSGFFNRNNESIWHWITKSLYKTVLTLVKILDDLCCLIFFAVWYTFTTPSVIIWSIKFDKAINTPVRPMPELIISKIHMEIIYFGLM